MDPEIFNRITEGKVRLLDCAIYNHGTCYRTGLPLVHIGGIVVVIASSHLIGSGSDLVLGTKITVSGEPVGVQ